MFQERVVNYVKFEALKPGEIITGHLIGMQKVAFEGKPNVQFTLLRADGVTFKLNGTRELVDKIHPFDLGSLIRITMGATEQLEGGRKTYHIDVAIDANDKRTIIRLPEPRPQPAPRGPGGEADPFAATDDDIPF